MATLSRTVLAVALPAAAAMVACSGPLLAAPPPVAKAGRRVLTTQFTYTSTVPSLPAGTKAVDLDAANAVDVSEIAHDLDLTLRASAP